MHKNREHVVTSSGNEAKEIERGYDHIYVHLFSFNVSLGCLKSSPFAAASLQEVSSSKGSRLPKNCCGKKELLRRKRGRLLVSSKGRCGQC